LYPYTTVFGLQAIIKKWLVGPVVTKEKIDVAEDLLTEHFKINGKIWSRKQWDYIVDVHGGHLPVKIDSVLEGTNVPINNTLVNVVNTDDNCKWLTNGLETLLLNVWYPTTVCTRSNFITAIIGKYFKDTVDDNLQWLADYYLHDFGQRGVTGMEAAGLGGMAHLVNFFIFSLIAEKLV